MIKLDCHNKGLVGGKGLYREYSLTSPEARILRQVAVLRLNVHNFKKCIEDV